MNRKRRLLGLGLVISGIVVAGAFMFLVPARGEDPPAEVAPPVIGGEPVASPTVPAQPMASDLAIPAAATPDAPTPDAQTPGVLPTGDSPSAEPPTADSPLADSPLTGAVPVPDPQIAAPTLGESAAPAAPSVDIGDLPPSLRDDDDVKEPWELSMAARETALAKAQEALVRQMKELEALQSSIEGRWREADALNKAAVSKLGERPVLVTPEGLIHLPTTARERHGRLMDVVAIVKKMKPKAAAAMMSAWEPGLAVDVVARLSPRTASPIVAAMGSTRAAMLTASLANDGAPTPVLRAEQHR